MEAVLENLVASWKECPRDIRLVFHMRYSRDLLLSKFRILKFESIPYFHIYQVVPAKGEPKKEPGTKQGVGDDRY